MANACRLCILCKVVKKNGNFYYAESFMPRTGKAEIYIRDIGIMTVSVS